MTRQPDGAFAGALYRTGLAALEEGVKSVKVSPAGSLRIAFADGEHAAATFTIDGRAATRSLTRQVFGPSPPLCR